MKHEECWDLLDDFADDLLSSDASAAVGRHVHDCAICVAELEAIRELKIRAATMPTAIPPHDDPWPGIASRLADPADRHIAVPGHRDHRPRRYAGFALAVAAIVAVAVFWPAANDTGPLSDPVAQLLDDDYSVLQQDGELVLAGISAADAAAQNELQSGMSVIDQAIKETRDAMNQIGDTTLQIRKLTHGYQKKMDLLQQLVRRASGA